jgi:hypothetical protein
MSDFDLTNLIGPVMSGIGGMAGMDFLREQGMFERREARRNRRFQREQFEYEQNLQQQMFEREDTAIQRRVDDLRASGLSPVLAAGQGARAGAPISVKAPQMDISAGRASAVQKSAIASQLAAQAAQVGMTIAQTKAIDATRKKTEAETRRTEQETAHRGERFPYELDNLINENQFLKSTLYNRIAQVQEAVRQTRSQTALNNMKREVDAQAGRIASVDADIKEEFRAWTQAHLRNVGDPPINPEVISLIVDMVTLDILKHDEEVRGVEKVLGVIERVVEIGKKASPLQVLGNIVR